MEGCDLLFVRVTVIFVGEVISSMSEMEMIVVKHPIALRQQGMYMK